jgi:hypothetical protein
MPLTAGTTYTYSIFLKAAERYIVRCYVEDVQAGGGGRVGQYLNLQTGTVISTYQTGFNTLLSSNLQNVGNGWYRFSWTVTAQLSAALNSTAFMIISMADATGNYNYTGDGTSGMYIWGAQMEVSNTVTYYQGIAAANTLVAPGFAKREDSSGNLYLKNNFDEFTGAPVVDSGLTLWLDAGQTTSYSGTGTTWTDISGTANNLTLTNSPTFNNKLGGGSFTFDGATNYAVKTTSTAIPSGSSPFTLSVWFYPTSSATSMRVVAYGVENTGQLVCIRINSGGAYVVTFAHWGGVGYDVGNGSVVNGNVWNNVTEVFDGTNDYMYINGVLKGTFTPSTLNIGANSNLYVGKRATGEFFAGSVGQLMLYNRALTADEITTNFNALRNRYGI